MAEVVNKELLTNKIMHEDNIFYHRINFFLLAESMLFLAFTSLIGVDQPNIYIVKGTIKALGIVISISWIYINQRQLSVIEDIRSLSKEVNYTFRLLLKKRKKQFSSRKLIAYLIPGCMLLAWITLIIFL